MREAIFCIFSLFHPGKRFTRTVCFKICKGGNRFLAKYQEIMSRITWNFVRRENRDLNGKVIVFTEGIFCFFFQCKKCNPSHFKLEFFYGLKIISRVNFRKTFTGSEVFFFNGKVLPIWKMFSRKLKNKTFKSDWYFSPIKKGAVEAVCLFKTV